ncbi:hypothetical protein [Agrococcus beijingensis]|uniref:hypothetical protein n=1 Tax=Agrococcus beijingensis TaxID=3068634 RepID=UPI0027404A45|nr:hypothetical protein [Agrococcus sp. REN33]
MAYRSPNRNYELRELEGNPGRIAEDAASFIAMAEDLDVLEAELQAIADSSVHRSKGTDALAELAGKARPEVVRAATRYRGTGETLAAYAPALSTAKRWIEDNRASVETAEREYLDAIDAAADARGNQDSLNQVWAWEDDPTDAQRSAAAAAAAAAEAAEASAKQLRDRHWETFETTFSTWSDAYDDAVSGIDGAIERAGNDDGFWEGLADFLDILGWVVAGLAVIALFISGPIAAVIMALVIIGSLVMLVGKIAQYSTGRTTLLDLGLAIFSVLTLGAGGAIARVVSKTAPRFGAVVGSTRSVAREAIRGGMRGPTLNPFTWHRPLSNRVGAWSQARAATPRPGHFAPSGLASTMMDSIRFGGAGTGRSLHFLQTARANLGQHPSVVSSIDDMIGRVTPSVAGQLANGVAWGVGTAGTGAGLTLAWWQPSPDLVPQL